MKYKVLIFLIIGSLSVMLVSCAIPATKEQYLKGFERLVKDVEKNAPDFKISDWRWANKKYRKYTDEWYHKFRDEFTLTERMQVAGLKIRYNLLKEGTSSSRIIDQRVEEELNRIGKDLDKYLDENLDRDIERISKGAREIGDSALKVVEDVLNEIRKEKE